MSFYDKFSKAAGCMIQNKVYRTVSTINDPAYIDCLLETLWEKGENAGYQHFLLFPTMFLPYRNYKKSTKLRRCQWDVAIQ